jgi:hypothetical protein
MAQLPVRSGYPRQRGALIPGTRVIAEAHGTLLPAKITHRRSANQPMDVTQQFPGRQLRWTSVATLTLASYPPWPRHVPPGC